MKVTLASLSKTSEAMYVGRHHYNFISFANAIHIARGMISFWFFFFIDDVALQENEIAYHDDKMKRAKEEGRKRRQQIEMHQSQIEEAQEKLDNMPSDPTDTDKLSRLARERTRLESQIRDKDSELEYKNSESNTIYAQIKQKENRYVCC